MNKYWIEFKDRYDCTIFETEAFATNGHHALLLALAESTKIKKEFFTVEVTFLSYIDSEQGNRG